ncbi:MAG: Nuclease, partial [Chlamydiae bacterium]|nr:Nuclease [Chlamydiota bacterium]
MAKRKRKRTKKQRKPVPKWQVFCLGVLVGLGLFWLPIDNDFSTVQFSQNDLPKQTSIFAKYLPITTPILEKEGFFLAYNGQTRNAHWVYHKLTSASLEQKTSREECDFKEDPFIPEHIRTTKSDYHGSGYDRGHLCPAADCSSQKAMEDSFFLTNISPQIPAFNRGYWKKLENHARDLTKQYRAVHVFSGPLYLSSKGRDGKRYVRYEVIGKHDVAVPTHFFMLIFVELPSDKMLGKAYILPNKAIDATTSLKKFSASIEEIEKASGV